MQARIASLFPVVLLIGCATQLEIPLPVDHPANPTAVESSLPEPSAALDAATQPGDMSPSTIPPASVPSTGNVLQHHHHTGGPQEGNQ